VRGRRTLPASALGVAALGALAAAISLTGCDQLCCAIDSQPIPLAYGPGGELLVRMTAPEGPAAGILDPGMPITFWNRPGMEARIEKHDIRILGPAVPGRPAPLRALFRDFVVVESPLGPIGDDSALVPAALLGADLLAGRTVEIGFGSPEVVFWEKQAARDEYLAAAGYAVLRTPRRGGGKLDLLGPRNWIGRRQNVEMTPSRMVVRGCAAAPVFTREDPLPTMNECCTGAQHAVARGVDLDLLVSTGVGPLVLGRAAWDRIRATLAAPPPMEDRPLAIAAIGHPIAAQWTSITRLDLVDRETDLIDDPGPCAELGRARRLEQVAFRQSRNAAEAECALPCDRPRGEPELAENSAAYLELEGAIEIAVIEDTTPWLQAIRAEIQPQGPLVDGIVGAKVLGRTRLELDYVSADLRAIFSCEPATNPANPTALPGAPECRAVGRCPRLPDHTQKHVCFGLPPHTLPTKCTNIDPLACTAPTTAAQGVRQ
jgi:hypothetical protein